MLHPSGHRWLLISGYGGEQLAGVVVVGVGEHLRGGALLDDPAAVHDRDVGRDVADHREVVGDEQHREAELALELADQVEHRALDRDVERRGDLVGDEHLRAAGERAGQRDPLPLAAGQLGRPVAGPRRVEVDQLEQPGDLGAALGAGAAGRQRLGDALADRHPRVERRVRVLEDHLQRARPAARRDRLAVEQDLAAGHGRQADRGARQRGLARTRTPPPGRRPGPTAPSG